MLHFMYFMLLLARFRLLSGYLLGKLLTRLTTCSLCILFVILVAFSFGFEGWIWVLIGNDVITLCM